jgi:hypothetical protein
VGAALPGLGAVVGAERGLAYEVVGDELFDAVPADLTPWAAPASLGLLPATDVARLALMRRRLADGWESVLWLDADVLVFDGPRVVLPAPGVDFAALFARAPSTGLDAMWEATVARAQGTPSKASSQVTSSGPTCETARKVRKRHGAKPDTGCPGGGRRREGDHRTVGGAIRAPVDTATVGRRRRSVSVMAQPAEVILSTLADPGRLLGVVERNVEAKLIAPVLELLGWDPARQVLWGPQVRRLTDGGRHDVEADVFVADVADSRLRFVVEAKRWARPLDAKSVDQTLGYLDDAGAHRALLTNGSRWLVLDAGSRDPVAARTLPAPGGATDVDDLVVALAPYLSPSTAPASPLPAIRAADTAAADVEQLAEDDPLVGELVAGLRALAREHAERIYLDAGPKGLLIRAQIGGRVIVPVNAADPLKPDLYAQELETQGVDRPVRGAYAAALRRLPADRTAEAVAAFLAALAAVIADLP